MYIDLYKNNELNSVIKKVETQYGVNIYFYYNIVTDDCQITMSKNDVISKEGIISTRVVNMALLSCIEDFQKFLEELAVEIRSKLNNTRKENE